MGQSQIDVSLGIVGIMMHHLLKTGQRLVQLFERLQAQTKIDPCLHKKRPQANGLAKMVLSLLGFPQVHVGIAKAKKQFGIVGIPLDGIAKPLQCRTAMPQIPQQDAQGIMKRAIIRIHRKGLADTTHGTAQVPQILMGKTTKIENVWMARKLLQKGLVERHGLLDLTRLMPKGGIFQLFFKMFDRGCHGMNGVGMQPLRLFCHKGPPYLPTTIRQAFRKHNPQRVFPCPTPSAMFINWSEKPMETDKMDFGPILQNSFGEYYLPAINQEIFSQSGADSFYHRHFDKTLQTEDSLYLIIGTDSGRLVNWVITCGLAEGSRYLFVEYPELVTYLQEAADLPKELPENVRICAPDVWLAQAEELALKDYCYLGNVQRIKSLAVIDAFFEGYLNIWNAFEEKIGQYQMTVGQETGARVFMIKGLENLAENRISARCLVDLFKGKTAILLAGGPSLKESFAFVKENRRHLVVLAVSRIAVQLHQEGIVPDFFFAIDPHDIIFHQSKGMLAFWQKTLLVNVFHLNPRLLSQWRGQTAYMGDLFPWKTDMNRPTPVVTNAAASDNETGAEAPSEAPRTPNLSFPGITVGHQALGMAVEMGFSEIILSGFDLCFDKEGFTHTEGSEERKIGPFTAPSELWVETNGGWQAETRYDFLNAIPSLDFLAKFASSRACRVVNPAKGAVKIESVTHLPWEALEIASLPHPAWEMIQTALPTETRESRLQHHKDVMEELLRVRGEVQKVMRLTTEAIDCNDRLFGRKGRPPDFKHKKRMDEIEHILDEDYKPMSHLVKRWGVGEFLKLSRPDKKKAWTDEEIEEAGQRYYAIYRESAGALTRLLDDIRQRLRARMEEEKTKPNLKIIMAQWKKDIQPGRVHVFLDRQGRSMEDFPEHVVASLHALAEAFQNTLDETETNYKKHCFQSLASPQAIRFKVLSLFKQKDKARLCAFADGLEKSASDNKEQYGFLIKGFLAELDEDPESAVRCFRRITAPVLLTDATLRLFTIALMQGDLAFALPIAKRLSERSPLHIPYYGDLLRMTGQREAALAIYTDFMKIAKNDMVTKMKLGKLHTELGQITEARHVFESIVEEDPHNKAALVLLSQLPQDAPTTGTPS